MLSGKHLEACVIFEPDPAVYFRPALVALRGACITILAFILPSFSFTGIDRMVHASAYIGAVVLSFCVHYVVAWFTVRRLRRRQQERQEMRPA